MKKIWMLLITALLCVQFTAMGQPKPPQPPKTAAKSATKGEALPPKQAKWRTAPIPGWYIHYDEAIKAAKKANKKIFVLNAGSDWMAHPSASAKAFSTRAISSKSPNAPSSSSILTPRRNSPSRKSKSAITTSSANAFR